MKRREKAGRFAELVETLNAWSPAGERAFNIIAVIIAIAFGVACLGICLGHYYIAGGAIAVFCQDMAVWTIATGYRLWVVIRGGVRWWVNRRNGFRGGVTDSEAG